MRYQRITVRFAFADGSEFGPGLLVAPGLVVARAPARTGTKGYQIIHLPTGCLLIGTVKHQRTAIAAALKLAEAKLCWPRVRKVSPRNARRAQPQWAQASAIMAKDRC